MAHQNTYPTDSHDTFNQITMANGLITALKPGLHLNAGSLVQTALAVRLEHLNLLARANRANVNATNPVPSSKNIA